MKNNPVKASLVDLLRSVNIESSAEITYPSGWSYHANYIGRIMHQAADLIEQSAQQSVHLTALRRWLAVSIFINVVLLAVVVFTIGGR